MDKMRQRTLMIAVLCCFCLGIVLFLPLQKVFVFTETRTEQSKQCYIPLTTEKKFQIRYTHSIHQSDVLETYQYVEGNRLQMLEMEYEDLAIGMPGYAEENQTLTQQDGKYFLHFYDKVIDNFTIYIGDLDLELVLIYQDVEYNLKENLQRGKSYLFQIKRLSFYEQWKGVRMK